MIWTGYIDLAEELTVDDSEAARRSAASRAYYGAFNLARAWLEGHVGSFDNRAVHRRVWDAFRTPVFASDETRTRWEYVGEIGETLRGFRNQADYDEDVADLDMRARAAVVRARRIASLLPELRLADQP